MYEYVIISNFFECNLHTAQNEKLKGEYEKCVTVKVRYCALDRYGNPRITNQPNPTQPNPTKPKQT